MDDQDSPPLLPRRRSRSLSFTDILSETPDIGPSQSTRDKRRRLESPEMGRRPSPLDVDDLLSEILLRLPALPSSLPRASLVCTRWRRVVTDPFFLRRFRARHWEPLGVFVTSSPSGRGDVSFSFISDPSGSKRFSVHVRCGGGGNDCTWEFQGCRHGLVLLFNRTRDPYGVLREVLVWNPVAGEHHLLGVPHVLDPNWNRFPFNLSGAVICASGDDKGPFKVALAWSSSRSAHICVYSSKTGVWGDVVSAAVESGSEFIVVCSRNVMLGNSLYWILFGSPLRILEFDLGSQNLAVIEVPLPSDVYANHRGLYLTTLAKGGGLSLMIKSANFRAQLWERTTDYDGVAQWMLGGTIELDKLLSLRSGVFLVCRSILGIDGDANVIFVLTYRGVFMVHLKLMQFKKIFETNAFSHYGTIHAFTDPFAPGSWLTECSSEVLVDRFLYVQLG